MRTYEKGNYTVIVKIQIRNNLKLKINRRLLRNRNNQNLQKPQSYYEIVITPLIYIYIQGKIVKTTILYINIYNPLYIDIYKENNFN